MSAWASYFPSMGGDYGASLTMVRNSVTNYDMTDKPEPMLAKAAVRIEPIISVCPAGNITLIDGKPIFGAACEGCVACIQFCPKRAINYGKTAKRRRYTHPQISYTELAAFYGKRE